MRIDAALLHAGAWGFAAAAGLALATWAASVAKHDVGIVDSVWGLLVWAPAAVVAARLSETGPRAGVVLALAAAWALRLSLYITWRHRGEPEDRRYQAIRRRNEPHFAWKSLYLVFGLQVVLAWIVALPLMTAVASRREWHWLDGVGIALFVFGLAFEAIADAQLARFRRHGAHGAVMDQGLWRYSRHPNYFGECCVWWGAWLVAAAAGAGWTIVSPLLMTVLLLKVSGVTLLEADLRDRRPQYADYVRRTPAFFPWMPRT